MTNRKHRKALARWEEQTRQWAHEAARNLVLSLANGRPTPATPYGIGVVLDRGEHVWAECPVQFSQEVTPADELAMPVRSWLVTSDRIVGRLGDDHLYGWRWQTIRGCRLDLTPHAEFVALDLDDGSRLDWAGPGVAPLAVAAVYRLHGQQALVDHPGLVAVRLGERSTQRSHPAPLYLPPSRRSADWWMA